MIVTLLYYDRISSRSQRFKLRPAEFQELRKLYSQPGLPT
jgi:hypothetical protein